MTMHRQNSQVKYTLLIFAILLAFLLGMKFAEAEECEMRTPAALTSDTRAESIRNQLFLRELKSVSCQLMYRVLYDDLRSKYSSKVPLTPSELKYYRTLLKTFNLSCVLDQTEVQLFHDRRMP